MDSARRSVEHGQARAEEHKQNNVELLIAITAAGIAIRIRQLADATTTLINKGNPHAAPPVARALFETCCVPIYMRRELLPRLAKGRVTAVHKLVFKMSLGGIGIFGKDHIRPVGVDSLIRSARSELSAMVKELPEDEHFNAAELIDIYYGPLTEFTHPNWGALSLSTKVGHPPTFLSFTPFDNLTMHCVASSAAYIMQAGGRSFDAVLEGLTEYPMELPVGDPLEDD